MQTICKWLICIPLLLTGCLFRTTFEPLTTVEPYNSLVGQEYVLLQDCYMFYYPRESKSKELIVGINFGSLPRKIEIKNVGLKFDSIKIVAIVPAKSTFRIKAIIREKNIETSFLHIMADLVDDRTKTTTEVDVGPIFNSIKQPPAVEPDLANPK